MAIQEKDFRVKNGIIVADNATIGGNVNVTGSVTATTVVGAVSGNADTATTLQTARTIGGVSFNGSANINLPGVNATGNQNTTGSAATLTTGRTIGITGDIAYTSGSFTGAGNVTGTGTLATVNSNVGSFTYANVTVNAKGLVTAVSSGAAPVTSVTGTSPISSSGGTTPAISLASGFGDTQNPYASKTANFILAAPNGAPGVPTFRAIVAADIPTLNQNTTGNATTATTATNQSGGTVSATTIAYTGTLTGGTGAINIGSGQVFKNTSGNVGIGTSDPLARFVVSNGSSENIEFTAGSATFNGGVVQYINRDSGTTRPDINYFLSGGNNGSHKFFTNGAERLRIDASGNVGIGTTLPDSKLSVATANGAGDGIRVVEGGTTRISLTTNVNNLSAKVSSGNVFLDLESVNTSSRGIRFFTGTASTERLRITSTGNVGIGTSAPTAVLDVRGSVYVIGVGGTRTTDTANGNGFEVVPGATNNVLSFNRASNTYLPIRWRAGVQSWEVGNVERMRIDASGNVGIGTSSPNASLQVNGGIRARGGIPGAGGVNNNGYAFAENGGDNDSGMFSTGDGQLEFYANAVERFRIAQNGAIGMGTFVPDATLHVRSNDAKTPLRIDHPGNQTFGTTLAIRTVSGTDSPSISIENFAGGALRRYGIAVDGSGALTFNEGAFPGGFGNQRMRLRDNGHLSLGSSGNHGARLAVFGGGTFGFSDRTIFLEENEQPGIGLHAPGAATAGILKFFGPGNRFEFRNSVDSGFLGVSASSFDVGSDYRLKTNIEPIVGGLSSIMSLNPKTYTLFESGKSVRGFIAHEVVQHIPEAVNGDYNAEDARGFPVYQTLDPASILATAVAAIQELKTIVDQQATEIQQLKGATHV